MKKGLRMIGSDKEAPQRNWILRSKIEMPRHNMRLISRPRLIEKMDGWLDLDLGVVSGPAGYAKSTTVAEWCRHCEDHGATAAWLSLDEADGEPAQFVSYLIAALSRAGVTLDGLETGAEEGFFAGGISTALGSVIEALSQRVEPVILVLDDYHRMNSSRVDDLLRKLIAAMPPTLTIIIATRAALPFDIAELLVAGRADTLGSEALRFSRDELASVFPADVGEEELALLHERTEGWPVAVQLARLLIADGPAGSRLENLHGHTGHIATYLAEKILSGLSQELQDFLCFTSLLERFNAELADAVMGRRVAAEMIDRLEPLNALVVRAETDGILYRYHHLFGEFLQTELKRRLGEEAVRDVHRRASRWCEANGYMAEAVHHAREAGELDRCAALVEGAGGWELILFGGIGYLRGLLQQIPDAIAQSYPRILLAKAYLALKDGLLAESRAFFDAAANTRGADEAGTALQRDLLNVGTLIFAYEDSPIAESDLKRLEGRLGEVPSDDPLTRSILSAQLIVGELAVGQFAAADHRAQTAMRMMREARTVLGLNYCYLHAGLAALYQGRLRSAEAHFGVARRMAEENFAFDPGLRALSSLLAGSLRHWMGEPANYPDEQAVADLEQVEHYDGWLDIYAAGLAVEVFQLNHIDQAIVRGGRIAERRGLRRLMHLVDAVRVGKTDAGDRSSVALKLAQKLPADIWRSDPFWWLPFLESRLALGSYFASIDRSRAIAALGEGLECARAFGANIYAIRLLVARALQFDLSGQRDRSLEDLIEALTIAAAEQIIGPFLDQRGLASLLRHVVRQSHDTYIDVLVFEFAHIVIARYSQASAESETGAAIGLSSREREVLDELANGRSNKEIARLLDMTEHTVKFHLKNIFVKLGAERRTDAVARARAMKLI